ncbi:MAG: hypothetical protein ACRENO_00740 [Thermodesulfobacteriota bacterium]
MTTEFERDINDPEKSAIFDLTHHKRPMLIAFGGKAGALGMPPFEFFKITKNLDINKIYLRDLSQTWYHSGLRGITENIDDTVSFLRSKIDESGANKIVVVGNSMGGYAAILFGILIKADIVQAFSAQTTIDNENFFRNKKKLQNDHNNFSDKYFDLKKLIKCNNNKVKINIYYDSKDRFDNFHAMYLDSLQNVTLHSFNGSGHGLIRVLKNSGKLQKIIDSSFDYERVNKTKKYYSFFANFFGTR